MDWETVKQYILDYGYVAVGVGTFFDQSALQAFVIGGGVVAQMERSFSIVGVMIAGALGSFASDMTLFGIGRWRASWLERIVRSKKGRKRLDVLADGMRRYAFPLIVFGRMLPWIGRFVPAAAGLRRVPFRVVVGYSVLGSCMTAVAFALLGYYAAESVEAIDSYGVWIWVGALIISIPVTAFIFRRFDRAVMLRLKIGTGPDKDPASENDSGHDLKHSQDLSAHEKLKSNHG